MGKSVGKKRVGAAAVRDATSGSMSDPLSPLPLQMKVAQANEAKALPCV